MNSSLGAFPDHLQSRELRQIAHSSVVSESTQGGLEQRHTTFPIIYTRPEFDTSLADNAAPTV